MVADLLDFCLEWMNGFHADTESILSVIASDCKERGDPDFWIASSLLAPRNDGLEKFFFRKGAKVVYIK